MNFPGIIGIASALLLIAVTIVSDSPLIIFINPSSALMVAGLALLLQWVTLGGTGFLRSLLSLRVHVVKVSPTLLRREDAETLRGLRRHLYAAGAIGTLVAIVHCLGWRDHTGDWVPWSKVAPLALLYATILAEIIVRPCVDRIDYLLGQNDVAGPEEISNHR